MTTIRRSPSIKTLNNDALEQNHAIPLEVQKVSVIPSDKLDTSKKGSISKLKNIEGSSSGINLLSLHPDIVQKKLPLLNETISPKTALCVSSHLLSYINKYTSFKGQKDLIQKITDVIDTSDQSYYFYLKYNNPKMIPLKPFLDWFNQSDIIKNMPTIIAKIQNTLQAVTKWIDFSALPYFDVIPRNPQIIFKLTEKDPELVTELIINCSNRHQKDYVQAFDKNKQNGTFFQDFLPIFLRATIKQDVSSLSINDIKLSPIFEKKSLNSFKIAYEDNNGHTKTLPKKFKIKDYYDQENGKGILEGIPCYVLLNYNKQQLQQNIISQLP